MPGLPIEFHYTNQHGRPVRLSLAAVHKVWIDRDQFGLVYTEDGPGQTATLRETTIADPHAAADITAMVHDLIDLPRLEFLEEPIAPNRERLTLEFRHPHPQTLNLAWRDDGQTP
jgi:hypothetical protein